MSTPTPDPSQLLVAVHRLSSAFRVLFEGHTGSGVYVKEYDVWDGDSKAMETAFPPGAQVWAGIAQHADHPAIAVMLKQVRGLAAVRAGITNCQAVTGLRSLGGVVGAAATLVGDVLGEPWGWTEEKEWGYDYWPRVVDTEEGDATLYDWKAYLYPPNLAKLDQVAGMLERAAVPRVDTAEIPAVEVPDSPTATCVKVLGRPKQLPSVLVLTLLRAMVKRFPGGLTIDEVRALHSKGDKTLKSMARTDPDWEAAVVFPGRAGQGGYRLRSWADADAWISRAPHPPARGGRGRGALRAGNAGPQRAA